MGMGAGGLSSLVNIHYTHNLIIHSIIDNFPSQDAIMVRESKEYIPYMDSTVFVENERNDTVVYAYGGGDIVLHHSNYGSVAIILYSVTA
jgi:hypothetical protein